MNCMCECAQAVCIEADPPLTSAYTCGCIEIGVLTDDTATVTLGLDANGSLTGDIIVSPSDGNQLEAHSDGLYVEQPAYGAVSTEDSWTENSRAFVVRQTVSLTLPGGQWLVYGFWNAYITKSNTVTSEIGARIGMRVVIDGEEGPPAYWQWNDDEGVLGHANSEAAFGAHNVRLINAGNGGTFDIDVEGFREPDGADNNVEVDASTVSAIAIKRTWD